MRQLYNAIDGHMSMVQDGWRQAKMIAFFAAAPHQSKRSDVMKLRRALLGEDRRGMVDMTAEESIAKAEENKQKLEKIASMFAHG